MHRVTAKLKEEFFALLPPTVFFFVALHVVGLVRSLMVKGTGLELMSSAQIAIGALILGKAVLVADLLPAINRFPHRPLAWNIAWKSVIYFAIATLIHYVERLLDVWKQAGGFAAANDRLLAEMVWPHFWGMQIVLALLILNYCVVRELARVFGERRLMQLFFAAPAAERPLPA
jgi:hypothetical protein